MDELLRRYQMGESLADSGGRYVIPTLPPGEYRVLAVFTAEGVAHRWYLPAVVTSGRTDLSLDTDRVGGDPYFGTR